MLSFSGSHAGMVKSVDTRDLKSLALKSVPVRVRLPAPNKEEAKASSFFLVIGRGYEQISMQVSSGQLRPPV